MFPASGAAQALVRASVCQPLGPGVWEGRQAQNAKLEFLLGSETNLLGKNSGQSKETMNPASWTSRRGSGSEPHGQELLK